MSKKDIDYTLRPIKFLDDPYYFLGKAIKVRKQRKHFENSKIELDSEIERLKMFASRPIIEEDELAAANKKIDQLQKRKRKKFDYEYKKKAAGVDLQAYQVERNLLTLQKIIFFPFKLIISILRNI